MFYNEEQHQMEPKEIKYSINESWRPTIRVGYIRTLNVQKNYGYIRQCYRQDVFFHTSNSDERGIRVGDIVGFREGSSLRIGKKYEASHIKLVENYTEEIRKEKSKYSELEWKMVMRGNRTLFFESIGHGFRQKVKLKDDIDNHVLTTNIDHLLNLYSVKVVTGGRWKPGEDDTAWVNIESLWLPDNSHYGIPEKYKYDYYINSLFKSIKKSVYYETAFFPYDKMIDNYKSDEANWLRLERETQSIEEEIKKNVRNEYHKDQHKKVLFDYLMNEINRLIKDTEFEVKQSTNIGKWEGFDKVSRRG